MTFHPSGETVYDNRSAVFEPLSTNAPNESLTLDTQLLETSQSFLDENPAVVSNVNQDIYPDNGFPFYFEDMLHNQLSPAVDPFCATRMQSQSQIDDINPAHTATLLFILEQSDRYSQCDNNGSGVVTTQNVTHANALNREEFEILTSKAKARIDALAEQVRFHHFSGSQEYNSTMMHTSQGAYESGAQVVHARPEGHANCSVTVSDPTGLAVDALEDDSLDQISWDGSEFLSWESTHPTVQHEILTLS
jgi:hypothetical protein